MRQMTRRLFTVAIAASAVMALTVPTAAANHQANPKSGPNHAFGEQVDYPLTFPVAGTNRYSNDFWANRGSGTHHAIDIMADKMTPVVAVADGTVTWVGSHCCSLQIDHDDGWSSNYIHLNNDTPGTDDGQGWGVAPGIKPGVRVKAGQLIGWVGDSGNAEQTPPHLQIELVDPSGVFVNPYASLKAAGSGAAAVICRQTDVSSVSTLVNKTHPLRIGDHGAAVTQLQHFLSSLGHDVGPADGVFGPKTLAGLRQFQERQGLNPDGVIGSETRNAIHRVADSIPAAAVLDESGRVLRPGARGTDVAQLQRVLALAGYDPGGADGILGPRTQAAIEAFQTVVGLIVDGKVGPNTRAKLSAALGLSGLKLCG